MSDSLVLEILKGLQAGQARIEPVLREHSAQLSRLELAMAGVRRDAANDAEALALVNARMDRLSAEMDRVNVRLGLAE